MSQKKAKRTTGAKARQGKAAPKAPVTPETDEETSEAAWIAEWDQSADAWHEDQAAQDNGWKERADQEGDEGDVWEADKADSDEDSEVADEEDSDEEEEAWSDEDSGAVWDEEDADSDAAAVDDEDSDKGDADSDDGEEGFDDIEDEEREGADEEDSDSDEEGSLLDFGNQSPGDGASASELAEAMAELDGEGDGSGGARGDSVEHHRRLKSILESLLFASDKPVSAKRLRQLAHEEHQALVDAALVELQTEYEQRGIVLHEVAGGWQFRTAPQNSDWVQQLITGRPVRLSRAQLETMAIIAYRQPITRPEIDEIRGVDTGGTLKMLLDRNLIRVLGKKEEPGRPLLYGTTKEFLEFFHLSDLRELPTLREYHELTEDSVREAERLGVDLSGVSAEDGLAEGRDDSEDRERPDSSAEVAQDAEAADSATQPDGAEELAAPDAGANEPAGQGEEPELALDVAMDQAESEVALSGDDGQEVPEALIGLDIDSAELDIDSGNGPYGDGEEDELDREDALEEPDGEGAEDGPDGGDGPDGEDGPETPLDTLAADHGHGEPWAELSHEGQGNADQDGDDSPEDPQS